MIASLFVQHSVQKLDQMCSYIERCLDQLSDDQIWRRGSEPENSIGNLLLHLCGNLGQWIGTLVAGRPDTRNRPAEFASDAERLSKIELKAKLRAAVEQAQIDIGQLTEELLIESVTTDDGPRQILTIVYQVVGHFQQHAGQILFAAKLLTQSDLGFYVKPSRASAP